MERFMILSIIFGMVIFLFLVALFFINTLLLKRKRVEHQFEGVVKCLGNRVELFNKMISFIEENLDNEDKYLNSLKKSSMVLNDIVNSNRDTIKEIKQSNKLLDKFNDLVNVYSKLSKDSNYLEILFYAIFGVAIFEEGYKLLTTLFVSFFDKDKSKNNMLL